MKRLMAMAALAVALAVALLASDTGAVAKVAQQGTATGTVSATAATAGTPAPTVDYRSADTLAGAMLVQHYTCRSCHSIDGSAGLGPTFKGLYGSNVTLADGSTVVADHAYLITSIVSPNAQVVRGFPAGLMPNFSTYMSSLDLLQIVTYIESLGSPPPTGAATTAATAVAQGTGTPKATTAATVAAAATLGPTITVVTKTPAAAVTGLAIPSSTPPAVQVSNQPIIAGTIIFSRVVSPQDGWIVVQADASGSPGAGLGHTFVYQGLNINVVVAISTKNLTPTLHAVLYADAGASHTFEVPGADTPAMVNGQPVQVTFQTTGQTPAPAAAASGTPAAATTPMAATGTPQVMGTAKAG